NNGYPLAVRRVDSTICARRSCWFRPRSRAGWAGCPDGLVGPSLPWPDGDSGLAELSAQGSDRDVEVVGDGREGVADEVGGCGLADLGVGHLPGDSASAHTVLVKVSHDCRPVDPARLGQLGDRLAGDVASADVVYVGWGQ